MAIGTIALTSNVDKPGSELLLFWNEGCIQCQALAERLQSRDPSLANDGPGITFVVGPDRVLRSDLAVGPDAILAVLDGATDPAVPNHA